MLMCEKIGLDLKVDKVTQSSTVLGSEFQTAGAEQRKARF